MPDAPLCKVHGEPMRQFPSGDWFCPKWASPGQAKDQRGRCGFLIKKAEWEAMQAHQAAAAPSVEAVQSLDPRLNAAIAALNAAALVFQGNQGPTNEIIVMAKRFYFELLEPAALGSLEP